MKIQKCSNCKINDAYHHPLYGYIHCLDCRKRQVTKTSYDFEMTSDDVKDMRKKHAGEIVQPFNRGALSKEYVERFGTKHLNVNDKDVKNAKRVWNDGYYKE